ncbi:PilO type IV pilus biogenesis protein [Pectobacterium atrosepticum ICMP 1526]|uniref:type 4b pilus protein PilO2 n=1 Tax=Pectobacterium atrosepticum TaxID=29471 RepID=UPI000508BE88|nr:type 4b pilus protein PilO2 [Pectobacterium atrosepticum]KFX11081.1 hypothetical protein JV34_21825 [Pectobacterium atrosepticum]KMK87647.1 PilO type IV pilus biogenesis protein [Pectobacterium atrosepticum ICMP 1526]QXE13075.1 pilus assembly protein PilO [Pectobacterium atrosepticum]
MKFDSYLVTAREGKSRYWLAGLNWVPHEKRSFQVPVLVQKTTRSHQEPGMGVNVVIGKVRASGNNVAVEGRGRLQSHHRHHQLYSLALAFCQQTQNGYGIYQLNSTDYVFLASINGLPAVTADKTGNLNRMQELLTLFLSMNEEPSAGWKVLANIDEPADVLTLPATLTARDRRMCRVEFDGLRGKRWLPLTALLLTAASAIGWWQYNQPAPEPELTAEEIRARAKVMFAKPAPPPLLPHPWATRITVPAMLTHCQLIQSPAPSVIEGWKLTSGTCSSEGVTLSYRILPGGTAEGFLKRSREIFGVTPNFNLKEGAREVFVPIPLPETPARDEVLPDASSQLMRVLSWFQRRQVMLNFSETPPALILPGKEGEPLPIQDWKEYAFNFSGPVPPALLFHGIDDTGLRLTRVKFELSGSTYSYTTEGKIYASTK